MILTMNIADIGPLAALRALRWRPDPGTVPGLRYAVMTTAAPLRTGRAIAPQPGRVGLIAAWDEDTAFDHFQAENPVAVLTLGRPRFRRLRSFLAASATAEREAMTHPALLAATGLARPPRLVATISLWRSVAEMRGYAVGTTPGGHLQAIQAIQAHKRDRFHHESAFLRIRPYAAHGGWDGLNPLSETSIIDTSRQ